MLSGCNGVSVCDKLPAQLATHFVVFGFQFAAVFRASAAMKAPATLGSAAAREYVRLKVSVAQIEGDFESITDRFPDAQEGLLNDIIEVRSCNTSLVTTL